MKYVRCFAFRRYLFGGLFVCLVVTTTLAQTYTSSQLLPPSGYTFVDLYGSMNNKQQVLGEVDKGQARFPALWTNGVPQILPIPSGYIYFAEPFTYHVNDSGAVVGTVQEANSSNTHVLIWTGGNPVRLQEIESQICPNRGGELLDMPSTYSTGLNAAGHIVGT